MCYLDAVVVIQSIASITRCKAESAPIVISVPQKSLSIDPTRPTIFKCLYLFASSGVISSLKKQQNRLIFHCISLCFIYLYRRVPSKDYPILFEIDLLLLVNHLRQCKRYY